MGLMDKFKNVGKNQNENNGSHNPANNPITNEKIEDVLNLLRIDPTFKIPEEVMVPEDLSMVNFSFQVPQGFDQGEVMNFVAQVRSSLRFYKELLVQRNLDVAKLASVIDKLQVEINNARWDQEVANGISVMPTMDDTDLENQLGEAKLKIRRLEDDLNAMREQLNNSNVQQSQNRENDARNADLMDALSVSKSKIASLEEENFMLKNELAQIQDDAEDELSENSIREKPLSYAEYVELGVIPEMNENSGVDNSNDASNLSLPDISDVEPELSLPEPDFQPRDTSPRPKSGPDFPELFEDSVDSNSINAINDSSDQIPSRGRKIVIPNSREN